MIGTGGVFDVSLMLCGVRSVLHQNGIPLVGQRRNVFGLTTATADCHRLTARGGGAEPEANAVVLVGLAENHALAVQVVPARFGQVIVCDKQVVHRWILTCIFLGGRLCTSELVGVHCACIGEGNPVHAAVVVYRNISKR